MSSQSGHNQRINASVKGLVLAGGKGTRLRPLTYSMAKQLVPVANKPILFYALDALYEAGIREIGIIISPETGDAIQAYVNRWKPDDVALTFIEQDAPLGLAHAVKVAKPFIKESPFLMYLGDNLINANLADHVNDFMTQQADASILLTQVKNPSAFGVAQLNAEGQVVRLEEKPEHPQSDLALIGVYLFNQKIFEAINNIKPSWRGELEITDAIQQLIESGAVVHSGIHTGWWLDTGKKDDLLAANRTVLNEFLVPTVMGDVDDKTTLKGVVRIGQGSTLENCTIEGPVNIGNHCELKNVTVGAYTSVGDACILHDCDIENSVLLENCQIQAVRGKINNSLLGKGCKLTQDSQSKESHQFLLADHSEIQVG